MSAEMDTTRPKRSKPSQLHDGTVPITLELLARQNECEICHNVKFEHCTSTHATEAVPPPPRCISPSAHVDTLRVSASVLPPTVALGCLECVTASKVDSVGVFCTVSRTSGLASIHHRCATSAPLAVPRVLLRSLTPRHLIDRCDILLWLTINLASFVDPPCLILCRVWRGRAPQEPSRPRRQGDDKGKQVLLTLTHPTPARTPVHPPAHTRTCALLTKPNITLYMFAFCAVLRQLLTDEILSPFGLSCHTVAG